MPHLSSRCNLQNLRHYYSKPFLCYFQSTCKDNNFFVTIFIFYKFFLHFFVKSFYPPPSKWINMQRYTELFFRYFFREILIYFSQCKSDDFNQKKSEKSKKFEHFFEGKRVQISTNFERFLRKIWSILE